MRHFRQQTATESIATQTVSSCLPRNDGWMAGRVLCTEKNLISLPLLLGRHHAPAKGGRTCISAARKQAPSAKRLPLRPYPHSAGPCWMQGTGELDSLGWQGPPVLGQCLFRPPPLTLLGKFMRKCCFVCQMPGLHVKKRLVCVCVCVRV